MSAILSSEFGDVVGGDNHPLAYVVQRLAAAEMQSVFDRLQASQAQLQVAQMERQAQYGGGSKGAGDHPQRIDIDDPFGGIASGSSGMAGLGHSF